MEDLTNDEVLKQLNELHSRQELWEPDLALKDVPALYQRVLVDNPVPFRAPDPDGQLVDDLERGDPVVDRLLGDSAPPQDPAGINVENILPERTRRRVRFNLPRVQI